MIIYELEDGGVVVCSKASSVPSNILYIEVDSVPDNKYRNAWKIDRDTNSVVLDDSKVDSINMIAEKEWLQEELSTADIEIQKYEDGHTRTSGVDITTWRDYRNSLRDHVQADTVMGDRPSKPV